MSWNQRPDPTPATLKQKTQLYQGLGREIDVLEDIIVTDNAVSVTVTMSHAVAKIIQHIVAPVLDQISKGVDIRTHSEKQKLLKDTIASKEYYRQQKRVYDTLKQALRASLKRLVGNDKFIKTWCVLMGRKDDNFHFWMPANKKRINAIYRRLLHSRIRAIYLSGVSRANIMKQYDVKKHAVETACRGL